MGEARDFAANCLNLYWRKDGLSTTTSNPDFAWQQNINIPVKAEVKYPVRRNVTLKVPGKVVKVNDMSISIMWHGRPEQTAFYLKFSISWQCRHSQKTAEVRECMCKLRSFHNKNRLRKEGEQKQRVWNKVMSAKYVMLRDSSHVSCVRFSVNCFIMIFC